MPNDLPLPPLDGTAAHEGPVPFRQPAPTPMAAADLEQLFDVPVVVSAVLGSLSISIGELLRLGPGKVLELERKVGEPVDIRVNNRLVARGEVVLVEDRLGITMTEIVKA